jgi:hypothetical protein
MSYERALPVTHPQGEPETDGMSASPSDVKLDTFGGKIQLKCAQLTRTWHWCVFTLCSMQ